VLALENVVEGMKITGKKEFDCGVCVMGKMTQPRNRKPDRRATKILELVHCDLAGPVDPIAKEGFRYALAFVDDYSGIVMIYFIRHESDTLKATETFLADSSPYGKIKCIRSDNGTEFISEAFENLLIKHFIKHEKSAPYSPHQNGTVGRVWRSIFDMARYLLIEAKLPKTLWTYAVMAAVYIRNRCYNHRLKKTPYEVFTSQKPNLQNMHVFGTVCYTYVQEKKKLYPRGEEGIFVVYDKGSPAYLIYFPETGSIKRIRCVRFTDKFGNDKNTEESHKLNIEDEMIVSLPPCPSDPQPTNENKNHVVSPNAVSDLNNDIGDLNPTAINDEGGNVQ
jgi:transposase InsO family protein